jgi:cytochrome c
MFRRVAIASVLIAVAPGMALADGNAARGERVYQNCAACHSLEPGRNMTGPSLTNLWNRKAGTQQDFTRYSPALSASGIEWNDHTLDAWLTDPQHLIPGNTMTFPGIKDAQTRADLLAFLRQATQPGSISEQRGPPRMGGMMSTTVPNLRTLGLRDRVQAVSYCRDTYEVTTADGRKRKFWERNLRFKTDSSDEGPAIGAPALVPAGMMGDRADVIFAAPDELGRFISKSC